jgi:hypothetical protein
MLTIPLLRWAIDHLRKPFIQRLISLVASTLLAMSLVYTTSILSLPPLGREAALSVSSQLVIVQVELGFVPSIDVYGQQTTEKHDEEGRLV